jgi:hypothetical protein
MASASMMPMTHVQGASLRSNVDPDQAHFPPLPVEPEKEQWELLDRSPDRGQVVSFCPKTVPPEDPTKPTENPTILHHAQSSPNLREYVLASDDESDESSSAVLVDDGVSDAGSSAVLVSSPPSVWSAGGAKLSFRDAILRSKNSNGSHEDSAHQATSHRKRMKVKPTFVVQPIKRCNKSTGDLQSLTSFLEEEVMGDTDAQEYYGRKLAGAQGRRNGLKTRPDEAKRLQMTMAKKADQRERQGR